MRLPRRTRYALLAMMLALLACGIPSLAQNIAPTQPIPTPPLIGEGNRGGVPTRAASTLAPHASPEGSVKSAGVAPPTWWPRDIEMPKSAELTSNSKRVAIWQSQDANAEGLRDFLMKEGTSAGYRVYVLTKSAGAIYDVLFVKAPNVYAANITRGANATTLTANLGALIHLKVTGAANVEVDLPVKDVMPMTPGGELFIGTEIPADQCLGCLYTVFIHIAPFKGPGTYASKPAGIYLIDPLIVPGADPFKEDYRWANDCTVIIKDVTSGTFQCVGLSNIYENGKKIDISGSWTQPPPP